MSPAASIAVLNGAATSANQTLAVKDTRKVDNAQPASRAVNRGPVRRRFKGYDDDDDDDDTVLPEPTQAMFTQSNNGCMPDAGISQRAAVSFLDFSTSVA